MTSDMKVCNHVTTDKVDSMHKELRLFWEQKEAQFSINIVLLRKCSVSACTLYPVHDHYHYAPGNMGNGEMPALSALFVISGSESFSNSSTSEYKFIKGH